MVKELLIAFGTMGVCVVIHVTGILLLGEELVRHRDKIEARIGFGYAALLLISIFIALIILHLSEAAIWGALYLKAGLFKNFEASLYFSLQSYSTVGYGDLSLPERWRLLGTIESVAGVLLCGLSAAFLFAIVSALFNSRLKRSLQQTQTTKP